ncbi:MULTISPECIES: DUF6783 domain-containing protein [Lachnospiraceae]
MKSPTNCDAHLVGSIFVTVHW